MVLVTWLAGAPAEFWALIGTIGATHVVFGALSGPVSRALLAVDVDALLKEPESDETPSEPSVSQSGGGGGGGSGGGGGGGGGSGGGRNRRSDN
jgi:uncharacterized membrane protein YgcG